MKIDPEERILRCVEGEITETVGELAFKTQDLRGSNSKFERVLRALGANA
jgi:hypothetical protein